MHPIPKSRIFLTLLVVVLGVIFSMPNLFGDKPAVQLTPVKADAFDAAQAIDTISQTLKTANIEPDYVRSTDGKVFVGLADKTLQANTKTTLENALSTEFFAAQTLLSASPQWVQDLGLAPLTKGLDLRGGVHLLLQVDTAELIQKNGSSNLAEVQSLLNQAKIPTTHIAATETGGAQVTLANEDDMTKAASLMLKNLPNLERSENGNVLTLEVTEQALTQLKTNAVEQNTEILRARMNSIGVAEPLIQRQGADRIVVQLPGLSDPQDAIDALSSTASLEYYIVDDEADRTGKKRFGIKFIKDAETGRPRALKRKMIISGSNIIDASAGPDGNGQIAVNVVLDAAGASKMAKATHENLKKLMAVVYIEYVETKVPDGNGGFTKKREKTEEVISAATIQSEFSKRFQTTGNFTMTEAQKLARSLRSGALIAPVYVIEERTVEPSAGAENIRQGLTSLAVGFILMMLFMAFYYRKFGLVAVAALLTNVVLMIAILSFVGATLTLPGLAGIVLTMGMAVDANILIFERIREEVRAGKPWYQAIKLGFDNAFSTITDANITTLIAAVILFTFGTGPIKGFAVTLTVGIATSMFTAIIVSRIIIYLWLRNRRDDVKLSI